MWPLNPLTILIQFVPSKLNHRGQLNPDLCDNSPTPMGVLTLSLCHLILQDRALRTIFTPNCERPSLSRLQIPGIFENLMDMGAINLTPPMPMYVKVPNIPGICNRHNLTIVKANRRILFVVWSSRRPHSFIYFLILQINNIT